MIDSYMVFKDCRPYCVSKLNCVKSAPVAALLSPFVIAPNVVYQEQLNIKNT